MLNLINLNKQQFDAVTIHNGPILVVAGAGTGKTRVLTTRIVYLIEELHFNPNKILAITFTNKASNEMKTRINNMLDNIYVPWIGTYHAICLRILKQDIGVLNRNTNFTVLDEEDQLSILRDIYFEGKLNQKDIKAKKALEIISNIKTNNIDLNAINNIGKCKELGIYKFEELTTMKYIYKMYCKKLLISNLLDFDDLLILTHKILDENKEIRSKWQNYFEYILVDEFQDTNLMQFEILSYLINPSTQNVFVVGDPDQTIYTWRGAYANIFTDFLKSFKNVKTCVLDINYRSTKKILSASNELIKNNQDRLDKSLQTNNDVGKDVIFFKGESQYDEANFVSKQIQELIKDKNIEYKDIVVLYRAKHLSRSIEQELISCGIPYYIYGSIKFYQRREIKDLIAYLKLISNANDELAIKRIINVPTRNIGNTTVERISQYAIQHNVNFTNALNLSMDSSTDVSWNRQAVNNFIALLTNIINNCKNKPISECLEVIIKATNYEEYIKSLDQAEERMENIKELKDSIVLYENKKPNSSISEYLQDISLFTDSNDEKMSKTNSVSLMTIHFAKGTEFKIVFLIGLNEGIFPSIRLNQQNDIEEERRICYVGMTRAKEKLFLSCSLGYSPTLQKEFIISRFINEIGKENYQLKQAEFKSISNADLSWYDSKKQVNYYENYATNEVNFKVGDVIAHTIFGTGVIVGVKDNLIDVLFKAPFGRKTLVKTHKAIKRLKN